MRKPAYSQVTWDRSANLGHWHNMPLVLYWRKVTKRGLKMPTRNVVLTDHQQDVIETLVESGRYQNASEVLREGLRLVEQREREDTLRLEALRHAVQIGLADLDAGRFTNLRPDGIDTLIAELSAEAGKRAGAPA